MTVRLDFAFIQSMLPKGLKFEALEVQIAERQLLIHCEGGEFECTNGTRPIMTGGSVSEGMYIKVDSLKIEGWKMPESKDRLENLEKRNAESV